VCTPSWAAPEQVTVRPIGPPSDVFALGLMLAKLVEAVVYGEERTFVVPTGGNNKRSMKVLANPDVFIDPTAGMKLDEPSRLAYQRFIAGCCAFDPAQRPDNGVRFADELSELLARHPLPQHDAGWLDLGWLAGTLERRVDLLGDLQPAWVLMDGSPFRY
jgi:serine/threonine protein kinase